MGSYAVAEVLCAARKVAKPDGHITEYTPFEWVTRLVAEVRECGSRVYPERNLLGANPNSQCRRLAPPQEAPRSDPTSAVELKPSQFLAYSHQLCTQSEAHQTDRVTDWLVGPQSARKGRAQALQDLRENQKQQIDLESFGLKSEIDELSGEHAVDQLCDEWLQQLPRSKHIAKIKHMLPDVDAAAVDLADPHPLDIPSSLLRGMS